MSIVTVKPQKILMTKELSGRTSAFRIAEIRPRVNGLIQKRLFTEGGDVTEGQVLYQIDPAPFEADLANAEAALAEAQAKLPSIQAKAQRYGKLLSSESLSRQDYDDAAAAHDQLKATITALQAKVATARINLGYTKVTAPISGRIGKSSVTDGALVSAYQTVALATIQQLDPIYVDVTQSSAELLRLKERREKGLINPDQANQNTVNLIMENGKPYAQEGTFQFSDVTVDPSTGSVTLRLIFPNPRAEILPGMFVRAIIKEGVNDEAILVAQQGVSRDSKGNPYALVVNAENKVEMRQLTLDRAIGNQWIVVSGLVPGDRVIVEGLQMLRPGTVVQVTPVDQGKDGQGQTAQADGRTPKNGGGDK
ncbi:efflux RND transporter periplasmic adaptor subunit [Desulfolutivibrio sulfoxidireducens]|uniref:efflux RND transporter periplasmic adaptor subunit n=1 Tax=Desulfolutivibrio sulfoxidireducens TaxID=2773299 RepID=UPI0023EC3FF9|nr:efflux RND transporter periplasmic adaptor subunit [Desulfolutivibrio sulfoxidireducens]